MKKRFYYTVITAAVFLLLAGCASAPPAFKNSEMRDVLTAVGSQEDEAERGAIFFRIKKSFFEKLFWKEEPLPKAAPHDLVITGRRTSSEAPKKLESNSKLLNIIDALVREEVWKYSWQGTVQTDGVTIPLELELNVTDGFNKVYRLKSAKSYSHETARSFTERLKKFVGADVACRMALSLRIDSEKQAVPFEVAHIQAADGTAYAVRAVRTFADSESRLAKEPTTRTLLFAREQRYEFVVASAASADTEQVQTAPEAVATHSEHTAGDRAHGERVVASCTLDDFVLYEKNAEKRTALKECVGLFSAFLWSLDEHERAASMLE